MVGFKDLPCIFSLGYEIVPSDGCSITLFLIIRFCCHFEPQSWWATLEKNSKTLGTCFFLGGKVVPESMAEIGQATVRLSFFLIPLFSVVLYMRGPKWSGFQPAINTPCQFEKVFLILSTTSEGFFPLELSSKWWRDFWTTINGNVNTRYSCA